MSFFLLPNKSVRVDVEPASFGYFLCTYSCKGAVYAHKLYTAKALRLLYPEVEWGDFLA